MEIRVTKERTKKNVQQEKREILGILYLVSIKYKDLTSKVSETV